MLDNCLSHSLILLLDKQHHKLPPSPEKIDASTDKLEGFVTKLFTKSVAIIICHKAIVQYYLFERLTLPIADDEVLYCTVL